MSKFPQREDSTSIYVKGWKGQTLFWALTFKLRREVITGVRYLYDLVGNPFHITFYFLHLIAQHHDGPFN